jgi:hypothetical protein
MSDELQRLCIRLLGDGPTARTAAETAGQAGGEDRVAALRAALHACRGEADQTPAATGNHGLRAAVAAELASATARLPASDREALALRDLLGLPYEEIDAVTGTAPEEVAPLLARARIRLRDALRGASETAPECVEHDRALRTIAARQDGEPVPAADEDWLIDHLGLCRGCAQDHAAMLEAAACYAAWDASPAGAPS